MASADTLSPMEVHIPDVERLFDRALKEKPKWETMSLLKKLHVCGRGYIGNGEYCHEFSIARSGDVVRSMHVLDLKNADRVEVLIGGITYAVNIPEWRFMFDNRIRLFEKDAPWNIASVPYSSIKVRMISKNEYRPKGEDAEHRPKGGTEYRSQVPEFYVMYDLLGDNDARRELMSTVESYTLDPRVSIFPDKQIVFTNEDNFLHPIEPLFDKYVSKLVYNREGHDYAYEIPHIGVLTDLIVHNAKGMTATLKVNGAQQGSSIGITSDTFNLNFFQHADGTYHKLDVIRAPFASIFVVLSQREREINDELYYIEAHFDLIRLSSPVVEKSMLIPLAGNRTLIYEDGIVRVS